MQINQNAICLNTNISIRERAKLFFPENTIVLPGTLGHVNEGRYNIEVYPIITNIQSFEPAIVLENVHNNTGLHAAQCTDDEFAYISIRRLFDGDVYLIRAVEGEYQVGMPVFATQTDNGVYVSSKGEGCFIGWSQEHYLITSDMMGVVDDGRTEVNNRLVNLLKVRVGTRWRVLSENV